MPESPSQDIAHLFRKRVETTDARAPFDDWLDQALTSRLRSKRRMPAERDISDIPGAPRGYPRRASIG